MKTRKRLSDVLPPPKKIADTSSVYSKRYRRKLKENPAVHAVFRACEIDRIKKYRSSGISEEAKEKNRKMQGLRQAAYRKRIKEKEKNQPQRKVRTRQSSDLQQLKWRVAKQKINQNMSYQKRCSINKKRREKYAEDQVKKNTPSVSHRESEESTTGVQEESNFPEDITSGSMRVAKSRYKAKILKSLPKNSYLKAEVLKATVGEQTPRSKAIIHQRLGVISPSARKKLFVARNYQNSLKQALSQIAKKRSKTHLRVKRVLAKALVVKLKNKTALRNLGISWRLANRALKSSESGFEDERVKGKDALSQEVTASVTEFFGDISQDVPNARSGIYNKEKDIVEPRKVLDSSLHAGFQQFQEKNPDVQVSFPAFKRLRPKSVMPYTKHRFRECLCEYCVNIDLKLKAVNSFLSSHRHGDLKITDKYVLSRMTLCPKLDGEYLKSCLDRECPDCGPHLLSEHLRPAVNDLSCTPVTWDRWQKVNNGITTRVMKVPHQCPLEAGRGTSCRSKAFRCPPLQCQMAVSAIQADNNQSTS
jgi:hypothetical protein